MFCCKQDSQGYLGSSKVPGKLHPMAARVQWVVVRVCMTDRFWGKCVLTVRELFILPEILPAVILCYCKHDPAKILHIESSWDASAGVVESWFSQSTSPHQSNFQYSATATVFVPTTVYAHQWELLLIVLKMHARMITEMTWPGLSVPVNIAQG